VILWDVNLWVYAFRSDSPLHEIARGELEGSARRLDAYTGEGLRSKPAWCQ
jgi:predicted nucleic acid-binding protein